MEKWSTILPLNGNMQREECLFHASLEFKMLPLYGNMYEFDLAQYICLQVIVCTSIYLGTHYVSASVRMQHSGRKQSQLDHEPAQLLCLERCDVRWHKPHAKHINIAYTQDNASRLCAPAAQCQTKQQPCTSNTAPRRVADHAPFATTSTPGPG